MDIVLQLRRRLMMLLAHGREYALKLSATATTTASPEVAYRYTTEANEYGTTYTITSDIVEESGGTVIIGGEE